LDETQNSSQTFTVPGNFLIDGPNCKIPNMNPFAQEAMNIFKRVKYEPCSKKSPLTSVEQNFEDDTAVLVIHESHKKDYLSWWHSELKVRELKHETILKF
jgi:hypothetical protein